MAIIIFQNSVGRDYTFQLFEKDGVTPRNITGLTVIWRFKSINNPNSLLSLPTTQTNSVLGEFYATMTTAISAVIDTYECQMEVSFGGTLLDPSEYFTAIVAKSSAVAG